ncbi:sterol desaturase family protein [Methylocystis sp. JAN1]|uniref:sterol desaturase family protein n=1 Tax=Methylocystis sp. JAN1 TaxID=3397211 RepID=UPI003FA1ED7D
MDLHSAIRFSVRQVSSELFSAGSIFSVYSLASSFALGFAALAYRRVRRRGRANLRAISRAVFSRKLATVESVHADVKLFVLSVIFMPAVIGGLVISSNAVATGIHSILGSAFDSRGEAPFSDFQIKVISTIVLFLAYEIGYFVDHYLKHRVPFLWELHKLHHTADVLTPLTNFRNHPIDNVVFGYMLAFFIGGASGFLHWLFNRPTEMFSVDGKNILFLCFLWTIGHLQHSQFWIPFSGFWGRIVLSPAHHQIHHSNDPRHFNRNLGSVLAVWDWIFGTLEIPTQKNPRLTYGVDEEGVNPHSSAGMLLTPVVKSAAELRRALMLLWKSFSGAWESAAQRIERRHG